MSRINLTSSDGFDLGAYQSLPDGTPKAGIVVIQEIFGVNPHIRAVADRYAVDGYGVVAPQIFDRTERDVELGYSTDEDWARGMKLAFEDYDLEAGTRDIQAAIDAASQFGKVGLVGYCFGGKLAWIAACECSGLSAAASYYGGGIAKEAHRTARCPVIAHFGELDEGVPLDEVRVFEAAQLDVAINIYPSAGHGFNCDHRDGYHAPSAEAALVNTLAFFDQHL